MIPGITHGTALDGNPARPADVLTGMDASVAFVGSGATLGMLLGSSLLGSRKTAVREHRWLALLLVGISAAMFAITLRHASWRLADGALADLVEYCAALIAGPLFAGYVRTRARGSLEVHPLLLAHFLPAAVVGLQILVSGGALLPFRYVMLAQFAYTALAAKDLVNARRQGVPTEGLRWPTRLVALAILVHLAQIVRTLFFDVPQLRNVVPITAVAGLEVLALLAFRESVVRAWKDAAGSSAARVLQEPTGTVRRERVQSFDHGALAEAVDAALMRDRLWADPDLGLDRLARAVGSTPHRVSSALNAERSGFFEYVSSRRLDAVYAALEDPANDIYTIDALAENAGFRSRSAFYSAFRKRFGVIPSQVRKRPPVPSPVSQASP